MRFLILNADYPEFVRWLYSVNLELEEQPYEEQMRVRSDSLFGVADFYSSNIRKLGYEAHDIHINNPSMQIAWAKEHGLRIDVPGRAFKWRRELVYQARRVVVSTPLWYLRSIFRPIARRLNGQNLPWLYEVLRAQIKHYRPDVLISQDAGISNGFFREIKPLVRLIVGQIASPLSQEDFSSYDLMISSLPNFVDYFRQAGIPSELNRFGFEPNVLYRLKAEGNKYPVSFVGSLFQHHADRVRLLTHLCKRADVQIWGHGIESVPWGSPIRRRYRGNAWGIEMYQILQYSKITLNHHIGVAERYANNMRLFEATGVGTLLITDWKKNLDQIFELGKEVIAYRNAEECAELVRYYLTHDRERETVAKAGQQRTLRDHTYYQRMGELLDIVRKYL